MGCGLKFEGNPCESFQEIYRPDSFELARAAAERKLLCCRQCRSLGDFTVNPISKKQIFLRCAEI
jgi:hypothetical protein